MKPKLSSSVAAHGIRSLFLALAFAGAIPAGATTADDEERGRIAAERAAIESRYSARERECRERFIVTSCVDDARRERRHGLDALRARQIRLDEARRQERAAERRDELAAKAAEDAQREREREARAAQARREPPRPLEPRRETAAGEAASHAARRGSGLDRPTAKFDGSAAKPAPGESAAARREREERNRASYEARQREAAEHRREVDEKAAQRLNEHAPAKPLPVPASAPSR
jgi:hypothetical protein